MVIGIFHGYLLAKFSRALCKYILVTEGADSVSAPLPRSEWFGLWLVPSPAGAGTGTRPPREVVARARPEGDRTSASDQPSTTPSERSLIVSKRKKLSLATVNRRH